MATEATESTREAIVPMTPGEAEGWVTEIANRLCAIYSEIETMIDHAAENFTEEHRTDGTLIRGMDADGNQITWTSDELRAAQKRYGRLSIVIDALDARGADGRKVISVFRAISRPIQRPQ